jgi:hypothetical protein
MGKMILNLVLSLILGLVLCVGTIFAADITFQWDANTEPDLAGYRLYQSDTSGTHAFGEASSNFVKSIPEGTETTIITVDLTSAKYWVLTAYDTRGLEGGPSNEVSEGPPAPPTMFNMTNIQAENVYINGDINVAEARVGTLKIIREEN